MNRVRSSIKYVLILSGLLLLFFTSDIARVDNNKGGKSAGARQVLTASNPSETPMDINNITSWLRGDGYHDPIVSLSWNGSFPKGTAGFIYAEGVVWGGKVDDGISPVVRVGGNVYASSCRAGRILTDASGNVTGREPDDPNTIRPYKVRRDWATADLTDDAAAFYLVASAAVTDAQRQDTRDQYLVDWVNWPAAKGAPYDDRNGNGVYDPDPSGRLQSANGDTLFDIPGQPGADQTMWIVYNDLDPGRAAQDYGSPPIGLEVQETDWAYNASNPFGDMIFKKSKIIYKGTATTPVNGRIDSMFIVQWADPDDGQYSDDFAGCDTSLSLGYVYNSSSTDAIYFNQFGLPPPAGGFTFLQGPTIPSPGDSGIVDLKIRHDVKNLPMTTFTYFAAGSQRDDPDRGGAYSGTLQWYNLMRAFEPRPQYPNGVPLYDANGNVTHYELAGDPVTGTGDLDGKPTAANPNRLPPGDRRIVLSSGPFTMARGDTQEVVTALVGGLGADYLSSITVLKYNVKYAHFAYNNLFNLPSPPPPPDVKVGAFDKQILLSWGDNETSINNIENVDRGGFGFEGYNIYQFPPTSKSLNDAVKIATFDKIDDITVILDQVLDPTTGVLITKPVQVGKNTGIQRFIRLDRDYIRGGPLVDGQTYYFAVTAYSYNPSPAAPFRALESSPVVLPVVPQSPNPGVRYSVGSGDTLHVTHAVGTSDGSVIPIVVDPSKLTGDMYKVYFNVDTLGNTTWSLLDSTTHTVVLADQTNQTGDNNYIFADGVQVKVAGPPPGMKEFLIPAGNRHFSPVGGFTGLGLEGFSDAGNPTAYDEANGTIGMAGHFAFGSIGTTLSNTQYHTVLLKFAAVDPTALWDPSVAQTDTNFSLGYRWLRNAAAPPQEPSFAPWIIHTGSGYPYQDFIYSVPFSAWDMETNPPTRLAVGMFENNVAGASVDGRYWPPQASDGDNSVNREFCFIFAAPYSTTPVPAFETNLYSNASLPMEWVMVCTIRNMDPWLAGDEFEIVANHVNGAADVFVYTAPAKTQSSALAKEDVARINVFPNPYYGFNLREQTRINKYVSFNHLPPRATIRIFNLAGVLVRVIDKDDQTQFAQWDLRNDNQLPVASGIYLIYIDMPDLGTTKILKLALVQEEQILRVY